MSVFEKKIIRVIQDDPELMHLTWMVNNICQNKCTYCLPSLNSGTGHHYKWENAKKFLKVLFERYPKIHCSITGGEPSMSPFLPEMVKMFQDAGHTIGMTSNAYAPVEYWQEVSKDLNYICFSYHAENPMDDFLDKVMYASQNTMVTVRVMMHSQHWEHTVSVYESICKLNNVFVEPVRILDWGGPGREAHVYTQEQLDWFTKAEQLQGHRKVNIIENDNMPKVPSISASYQFEDGSIVTGTNTLDHINAGQTNFSGYVCEIGLKSLFIDSTGDVLLSNCCVGGTQGHLDKPEEMQWPEKPVICTKKICHCTIDVNINKWKRGYFKWQSNNP